MKQHLPFLHLRISEQNVLIWISELWKFYLFHQKTKFDLNNPKTSIFFKIFFQNFFDICLFCLFLPFRNAFKETLCGRSSDGAPGGLGVHGHTSYHQVGGRDGSGYRRGGSHIQVRKHDSTQMGEKLRAILWIFLIEFLIKDLD